MMFPVDGSTYYYSERINDLFYLDWVLDELNRKDITDIDIQAALVIKLCSWYAVTERYSDISVHVSKMLHLFPDNKLPSNYGEDLMLYLMKRYPNANVKFVREYYKKSNSIADIPDGNEIMIVSKGYYVINTALGNLEFVWNYIKSHIR